MRLSGTLPPSGPADGTALPAPGVSRTSFGRRHWLGAGLVASALAGTTTATAQQKLPKALVQYQDTPKGSQKCLVCLHFQPPDACAIVEGPISPEGWCAAFAPKSG
jgi:hypothetical protein